VEDVYWKVIRDHASTQCVCIGRIAKSICLMKRIAK
jgi:hypothetical protein